MRRLRRILGFAGALFVFLVIFIIVPLVVLAAPGNSVEGITAAVYSQGGDISFRSAATTDGQITGKLRLEGREQAAGTVATIIEYGRNTVVTADGSFTFTDLPVGSYTLVAKAPGYLQAGAVVAITPAAQDVHLNDQILRAGDINGDNLVSLPDLVLLASAYRAARGDVDYDSRADFDANGRVDLVDLSLLAGNYRRQGFIPGPGIVPGNPGEGSLPPAPGNGEKRGNGRLSFTAQPSGLHLAFSPVAEGIAGPVVYYWDFGDGYTSREGKTDHYYRRPGSYQVTLMATDASGVTLKSQQNLVVTPGVIKSVRFPALVPQGMSLPVEVSLDGQQTATVTMGPATLQGRGPALKGEMATTSLTPGENMLVIQAGGETWEGIVKVVDAELAPLEKSLRELEATSVDELHLIANDAGRAAVVEPAVEKLQEAVKGEVAKITGPLAQELVDRFLPGGTEGVTHDLAQYAAEHVALLENILKGKVAGINPDSLGDTLDKTVEAAVDSLDRTAVNGMVEALSGKSREEAELWLAQNVVGPVLFNLFCRSEEEAIKERTDALRESLLLGKGRATSPKDAEAILQEGQELLRQADRSVLFRLGGIMAPTLPYLEEAQDSALHPGGLFFGIGPGELNPAWIVKTIMADANALMTIPAELNWIEATPDPARPREQVLPAVVAALVEAARVYMQVAEGVKEFSPYVIGGGLVVATDLLSAEVNERHELILKTALGGRPLTVLKAPGEVAATPPPAVELSLGIDQQVVRPGEPVKVVARVGTPGGTPAGPLFLFLMDPGANILEVRAVSLNGRDPVEERYKLDLQKGGSHNIYAYLANNAGILAETRAGVMVKA